VSTKNGSGRANPCEKIHPPELRYNCDIQIGLGTVIHHNMAVSGDHVFLLENDFITGF
jgi:hypothetical protein